MTGRKARENWVLENQNGSIQLDIDVTFGKDLDIVKVKREWPYQREVDFTLKMISFFKQSSEFQEVERCPVCDSARKGADSLITVCGQEYLQCGNCTHVFATAFPSPELLERFYRESAIENPYYVNPEEIELRTREIYLPKAIWIRDVYTGLFGRSPLNILDIGAGAGHFLNGCKRVGLDVWGIEYSKKYVEWCKEQFQINLHSDPQPLKGKKFDVVCSFNVIEHAPDPHEFLDRCKEYMHERSLVVIETPKVNSLTTCVQKLYPDAPRGHLVPYEHNHLFTDSSLASLLVMNHLAPKFIWYYGQDLVELLLRICAESGVDGSKILNKFFGPLQPALDVLHGSDLMLVAAVHYP